MERESDIFLNTVPAEGQLQDSEFVSYHLKRNAALRVLFVGNSITRHGVCESIGWHGDYGMAASCAERDYVHLTVDLLEKQFGAVSFCIAQAAEWERHYEEDGDILDRFFASIKTFAADIVIIRIGENIDRNKLSQFDLTPHFRYMVDYFSQNAEKKAVTSLFWGFSPIDNVIKAVCEGDRGLRYVPISHFGARDDCKALTEYAHRGVALHPNDKGMREIADAVLQAIKE